MIFFFAAEEEKFNHRWTQINTDGDRAKNAKDAKKGREDRD